MKFAQRVVDSASSATQDGGAAEATEKSKLQEMAKEVIHKARKRSSDLADVHWRVVLALVTQHGIGFTGKGNKKLMRTKLEKWRDRVGDGVMPDALKDAGFKDEDFDLVKNKIVALLDTSLRSENWVGEGCGLMKLAKSIVESASSTTQDGGAAKATEKSKLQEMAEKVRGMAGLRVSVIRFDSSDSE